MLAPLFAMVCATLPTNMPPGNYTQACQSSMEAGAAVIGVEQQLSKANEFLNKEIEKRTNHAAMVSAGIIYVAAIKKELNFATPIRPFADSLSMSVRKDGSANLALAWSF